MSKRVSNRKGASAGGSAEHRMKQRGTGKSLRAQRRRQIREEHGVGPYGEKLVPVTTAGQVVRKRAGYGDREAIRKAKR